MTATRICVLRAGKEYRPVHVQWLAKQVPGLVCLSDTAVAGVPTIPLNHDWQGWWAKMELFRPDIEGDLLYFDLDTVVRGNLSAFERGKTTVLRDFYHSKGIGSGFMYIAQADKQRVWESFTADPERHMAECVTRERWGDQGFLQDFFGDCDKWQDALPDRVASYKVHCRHTVPKADVVCFHGKPRPWQVRLNWVPRL